MKYHGILLSLLASFFLFQCAPSDQASTQSAPKEASLSIKEKELPTFSLAQWTYHKALQDGTMSTFDFVRKAGQLEFDGVEYVNQFFMQEVDNMNFLDSLNIVAKEAGVQNVLIMLDDIGHLCATDSIERAEAVAKAKQWIDAAQILNCQSIRVNAHGDGSPEAMKLACQDGIGTLAAYGKQKGITVLIENHGGISNNGAWLADLLEKLQSTGVQALPDFNNWCMERANGELWGGSLYQVL